MMRLITTNVTHLVKAVSQWYLNTETYNPLAIKYIRDRDVKAYSEGLYELCGSDTPFVLQDTIVHLDLLIDEVDRSKDLANFYFEGNIFIIVEDPYGTV